MNNLLKSEWLKMIKSRTFLICIIVSIGIAFLTQVSILTLNKMEEKEATQGNVTVAITQPEGQETGAISPEETLLQIFSSNMVQLCELIFVAIFVVMEFSGGAIKNIISKGFTRRKVYLSKYIITVIGSELIAIAISATMLIMTFIIWGASFFSIDLLQGFLKYIGVQLFINLGMSGFFVMLAIVTRHLAITIAAGIGMLSFFPLILMWFDSVLKLDNVIGDLWFTTLIQNCSSYTLSTGMITKGIVVSIVYLIITIVTGIFCFSRVDI